MGIGEQSGRCKKCSGIQKNLRRNTDPGVPIDERDVNSKLFIDATIPFEWKKKPIMVKADPDMIKKVNDRWDQYKIRT